MKHVNLHYIRAAIEKNTGVYGLRLEQVRNYLVEEGLLTPSQARRYAHIFNGYGEFYSTLDSIEGSIEQTDDEEVDPLAI